MRPEPPPAPIGALPLPDTGFAHPGRGFDALTLVRWAAWVAFGVVTAVAVGVTAGAAVPASVPQEAALLLLLFFVTVLVGSSLQTFGPGTPGSGTTEASRTVDVGSTAALALALTPGLRPGVGLAPMLLVVAVGAVGLLLGGVSAVGHRGVVGLRLVVGRALPRVVTVAALMLLLTHAGASDPASPALPTLNPQARVIALLAIVYLALLLEAPLRLVL